MRNASFVSGGNAPLREKMCLLTTLISTVSVRMAVTSLPVPLAKKGSALNRQDVRLTSPIRAGHVRNRPIPVTSRSIGASLRNAQFL